MSVSVSMQRIERATVNHFSASDDYDAFSTVTIFDDAGGQVKLFFTDAAQAERANKIAEAINAS